MQIRLAEESDAAALAQVVVTTYRAAHRDHLPADYLYSSLTYKESARNWQRTLQHLHHVAPVQEAVFVAEGSEQQIIGVAMGGPERAGVIAPGDDAVRVGELYLLYILPRSQRHGVGQLLIATVARWLHERGMREMRVRVLRENLPARRFYAALGGEEVGEEVYEDAGALLHEVVYAWTSLTVAGLTPPVPERNEEG